MKDKNLSFSKTILLCLGIAVLALLVVNLNSVRLFILNSVVFFRTTRTNNGCAKGMVWVDVYMAYVLKKQPFQFLSHGVFRENFPFW